jgi:DNA-binding SARP family transcriptional activator
VSEPAGGVRPARPPRGREAWALLAYLLLADRPPGRRHLAELLFADADDPLGVLRWTQTELLEGVGVTASPAFESWLVVERHRIAAAIEARLRHAAHGLLAAGRAADAVAYAAKAVARNPLEEGNHELLVRCLAAAGTVRRRCGRWPCARTP